MQRGRNLLILLVLGLGLGAYVYFVEMKREPVSDTAGGADGTAANRARRCLAMGSMPRRSKNCA